ncbi:MAG: carboxymuconolactone decarboxylase family protein [Sphingobium sp.]
MAILLDPAERTARGVAAQTDRLATPVPNPQTPYQAAVRDFVFAEVWTRPALDLRARYLISMAGACNTGDADIATAYARGALSGGELTLAEMREAALHAAVYCGWSTGGRWDRAVTVAATELGLPAADFPPIRAEPWEHEARLAVGAKNFADVMTFGGPPPQARQAFFEGGINGFVFGEMWRRPGLDERSRRWITVVGVCDSAAYTPIHSHIYAAMKSGNATQAEMLEFVLQYAIYAGWPKASVAQGAVMEQGRNVEDGLPFSVKGVQP